MSGKSNRTCPVIPVHARRRATSPTASGPGPAGTTRSERPYSHRLASFVRAFVVSLLLAMFGSGTVRSAQSAAISSPAPPPLGFGPGARATEFSGRLAVGGTEQEKSTTTCAPAAYLSILQPSPAVGAAPRAIAIRGSHLLLTVSGYGVIPQQPAQPYIFEVDKETLALLAVYDLSATIGATREIGALASDGADGWWAGEYGLESPATPRIFHLNSSLVIDSWFDTHLPLAPLPTCNSGYDGGIDGLTLGDGNQLYVSTNGSHDVHVFRTDGSYVRLAFTKPYEITGHAWDSTRGKLVLCDVNGGTLQEVDPPDGNARGCVSTDYANVCTFGSSFVVDLEQDADGSFYWFGNLNGEPQGNRVAHFHMGSWGPFWLRPNPTPCDSLVLRFAESLGDLRVNWVGDVRPTCGANWSKQGDELVVVWNRFAEPLRVSDHDPSHVFGLTFDRSGAPPLLTDETWRGCPSTTTSYALTNTMGTPARGFQARFCTPIQSIWLTALPSGVPCPASCRYVSSGVFAGEVEILWTDYRIAPGATIEISVNGGCGYDPGSLVWYTEEPVREVSHPCATDPNCPEPVLLDRRRAGARIDARPAPSEGLDQAVLPALRASPVVMRVDTWLKLASPVTTPTDLAIHDIAGRVVARLSIEAGSAGVRWDGSNERGEKVRRGIYLARVARPGSAAVARIIVIR